MCAKNLYNNFKPWIERVRGQIRIKPYDILHFPSFLLGCFITINLILLEPIFFSLLGGLLISIITLLKYSVIVGGVVVCGVVLTSKENKSSLANKSSATSIPSSITIEKREDAVSSVEQNDGSKLSITEHSRSIADLDEDNDFKIVGYDNCSEIVNRKQSVKEHKKLAKGTEDQAYNCFIQCAK